MEDQLEAAAISIEENIRMILATERVKSCMADLTLPLRH